MGLPKQVTEALKEVETIESQLRAPAEAEAPAAQPVEPSETPPAVAEPAPAAPAPAPVAGEDDGKWEQRYRTLKGMYDAEVPRLHAQVKELTAGVSHLQAQLAQATEQQRQPKAAAPQSLVTDEDVEAFGSDLIEVQRKVAREVAAEALAELDQLRAENVSLREQVNKTGAQVAEATFDQQLHRLVPDFAELNNDPKWIAWLDEIDPILRGPRRVVAQEALSRGDAAGVAYYVDLFRKGATPAGKADKAAELERQIQPRRSSSAATPASQGAMYTSAQVGEMFARAARLGATGQVDEARKLEAEIDAAYMEGRVTD